MLGTFLSIPRGIVAGESGLTPARTLLNNRQARFTQRLYARPNDDGQSSDGPEEILTMGRSALTTRLRAAAALRRGETVEAQRWSTGRLFPGHIVIEEGRRPGDHERVETPRHHLDQQLASRQRNGGSGLRLAVTWRLGRSPLSPRREQRDRRRGGLRYLPDTPNRGPTLGERPPLHGLCRLDRRHRPGEIRRPRLGTALCHRGNEGLRSVARP